MLFVDDSHAESVETDILLDNGMRTDNDMRCSSADVRLDVVAKCFFLISRKQTNGYTQRLQPFGQ